MFEEIRNYIRKIEYENGKIPIGVKLIFLLMIIIEIKNLMFFRGNFAKIIIEIFVLIISLLFHELGHGYAAKFSGDKTAEYYGRLSLNPFNHLDPLGTILPIIMIIMGFPVFIGWAKPVPINYSNLKNGRLGEISVALAGVTVNFLIALVSIIIIYSGINLPLIFGHILSKMFIINLSLCAFNLIPIPPLDGSRVVASFLDIHRKIQIFSFDRFGFFIIMLLSYAGIIDKIMKFIIAGEIILIESILRLIY